MLNPDSQYHAIHQKLHALANEAIASHSQRFFKTGPGQYGEGDQFLGLRVPQIRQLEKKFKDLNLSDTEQLIQSPWHEIRLFALIHLGNTYQRSKKNPELQEEIFQLYLNSTQYINNWDLVDCSAHKIVGPHLQDEPHAQTLLKLADSPVMWERRIAMVACWYYNTKSHQYHITYQLAERLVNDPEDLMHKAVGWMLREMGKKDLELLFEFLNEHAATMPRTALRYSLEKVSPAEKHHYMTLTNL